MEQFNTLLPGRAYLVTLQSPNSADTVDVEYSVDFECRPEDTHLSPYHRNGQPVEIVVGVLTLLWLPGAYRFTDNNLASADARLCVKEIPFAVHVTVEEHCGAQAQP